MPEIATPWFADRPGTFVAFRVNRRPLGEDTLLPAQLPEDAFDHFVRALAPGWEVVTGRRNQRTWKAGGIQVDWDQRTFTGKLGWVPKETEVVEEWSDEDKDWVPSIAAPHGGRVLPLGFDGETRLLTVLRDGSSHSTTIASVLERILSENEQEMAEPTTEWSVEPILDERDFLAWLDSQDVVERVSFVAKLPNPEPREEFENLVARMERRRATKFTEIFTSDRSEGLIGVQEDPDFRQAVKMGSHGFATLSGRGRVGPTETRYSQSERVVAERVDELPGTWGEVRSLVVDLLKDRLRRFLDEAA